MKLNARQIESAKPKDKPYKLSDGGGMYLEIFPNGTKSWRMKYRIAGKEKRVVFGVYPTVSLADARGKREEAKRTLAAGGDPGVMKKMERVSKASGANNTFELIALEWHAHKCDGWSKGYSNDILEYLKKDIFPHIGKRVISDIKPPEMLSVLRKMEQRGVLDKLRKTRQACRQIFTYAVISGRAENNPVVDLAGVLKAPKQKHFPHLSSDKIADFLRSLNNYSGSEVTKNATKLLMLTGTRTIELRAAEWAEFDLDSRVWQVPNERMKMKRPHIVPLSEQAVCILSNLRRITGGFKFVFPGRNDAGKPMSEASINQVIKRIGYGGKVTGHGFRHTMSTILHEQGFNSAWIELQLAHVDKNSIRGTYNHAQYLEGRREMLQWYADYIESLERS
ncbi:tyrosine-type recombinase/integrase [Serratia bockelmannii]|uniref:tyrosine-type recombinase/integrase n=1 Tax=Serratia TaxID=613 RepID=UPI0022401B73|nr:tyrosine-type recombinase/integrase [Serratia bockelmannii]BEN05079.1 integrase [Serratia marcescens]MCW7646162.1 tyrosine-type recombinase/integrase [Serratia bockelmannii]MCW7655947.1 tyrosine-type recombinase/integrase [Serratia bockelmannii]MCW7675732.1 tyrosine-type recombinase/integrase [Serratia bockelmannii]MCW7680510.1 tyrosine-type recombinase/integrase [Serratia bockelmannii]